MARRIAPTTEGPGSWPDWVLTPPVAGFLEKAPALSLAEFHRWQAERREWVVENTDVWRRQNGHVVLSPFAGMARAELLRRRERLHGA